MMYEKSWFQQRCEEFVLERELECAGNRNAFLELLKKMHWIYRAAPEEEAPIMLAAIDRRIMDLEVGIPV